MDPITTAIVAALGSLGTDVVNLSKDIILESYNALKTALKQKLGVESDLVDAVEGLEKKPDSDARKAMLQEEIETAKINEDNEILQLAQKLLEKLEQEESTASKYQVEFQGEVKGVQIGDHNVQENKFD